MTYCFTKTLDEACSPDQAESSVDEQGYRTIALTFPIIA
jgi:hypothetical protein